MIENTLKLILPISILFEPNTGALDPPQYFELCNFLQLQHPWPEYSFLQIEFMISRNFNIYVSSAANFNKYLLINITVAISIKNHDSVMLFAISSLIQTR